MAVDFLSRAIPASAMHAFFARVTNTNAPMAVAIAATTDESLTPLVEYIYQMIIKEKPPSVHNDKNRELTTEKLMVYVTLKVASGYVGAKVAEKLGYPVNILPYLIQAQFAGSIYTNARWAFSLVQNSLLET